MIGPVRPTAAPHLTVVTLQASWKASCSAATYHTKTTALRRVLRAYDQAHGTNLASAVAKARQPKPRNVTATREELERLFLHIQKPWVHAWLNFELYLGLRSGDCLRLRLDAYDPQTRTVSLVQGKTGEPLTLPCPEHLEVYFTNPPDQADTVLAAWNQGQSPTHNSMKKAWPRLRRKAGINPQLKPHDLRRTAATVLMDFTHDVRAVQQFLGHRRISSTAHYIAPLTPEKLRQQILELSRAMPTNLKQ
jgi:integrase